LRCGWRRRALGPVVLEDQVGDVLAQEWVAVGSYWERKFEDGFETSSARLVVHINDGCILVSFSGRSLGPHLAQP
jgi:hypothetical protein